MVCLPQLDVNVLPVERSVLSPPAEPDVLEELRRLPKTRIKRVEVVYNIRIITNTPPTDQFCLWCLDACDIAHVRTSLGAEASENHSEKDGPHFLRSRRESKQQRFVPEGSTATAFESNSLEALGEVTTSLEMDDAAETQAARTIHDNYNL